MIAKECLDDYAVRSLSDFAQVMDNIERNRERRARAHPQRRSQLGVDDAALAPLAMSTQVQLCLTMGVDHLSAIADLIGAREREVHLRLVALFPLIRSAMECSATALWLLAPEDPAQRHERSIRLYWNDLRQDREMYEEYKRAAFDDGESASENSEALTRNAESINSVAERLGITPPKYQKSVFGYRAIVGAAGAATPGVGEARARFLWHQISGLTHPQMTRLDGVTDQELVGAEDPYLETKLMTIKPVAVAYALNMVGEIYGAAELYFRDRALRPAGA